jgi:iron complex transport system substrate-binding protein
MFCLRTHRSSSSPRRLAFWIAVGILLVTLGGCRRTTTSNRDAGARERIVSLSPSTTEALYALGAGTVLVGRSRYCDSPPEVTRLPVVGGYTDPNFEAIFALSPTLVVGARGPAGPRLEERLRERNIRTFFPETESVTAIDEMLVGLGREVGRNDEARALVARNHARIEAVRRAVEGQPRPRVLMLFDVEPIVAAGPKSFPDELISLAGAKNAVVEGAPYPVLSIEHVLVMDPDIVVDTTVAMSPDKKSGRLRKDSPGWQKLRAVREGKIIGLADESVLRPGPRIADAVASLARLLHPNAQIE